MSGYIMIDVMSVDVIIKRECKIKKGSKARMEPC